MMSFGRLMVFRVLVPLLLLNNLTCAQLSGDKPCFCKLSAGAVHECACNVDTVDEFNNKKFFSVLQSLLQKNFFRYYKVNMDKPCPFWTEERECSSQECGIQNCDDEVPIGLKSTLPNRSDEVRLKKLEEEEKTQQCDASNKLDPLDKTISEKQKQQFDVWAEHDDAQDKFCDVDDEQSVTMHYVDLQRNPERYTGYKGNSAVRVWKSIYEENCFKPDPKFDKNFLMHPTITGTDLEGLCLEKRVFYRLISGLHTSITISIAAHNYQPDILHVADKRQLFEYVFFESAIITTKAELIEKNEHLINGDLKLTDQEMNELMHLVDRKQSQSKDVSLRAAQKLLKWPAQCLLPALDVFRLALTLDFVPEHFFQRQSDALELIDMLCHIAAKDTPATFQFRSVVCKILANLFIFPIGCRCLSQCALEVVDVILSFCICSPVAEVQNVSAAALSNNLVCDGRG